MNKFKYILILILISIGIANAQKIRIERTDVDSSRLNFVTATLKFGFNVYLDGVQSANGAAFTLNFTKNDYIKYSEFQAGDFGKPIVMSMLNPDGSGRIVVGVTTGTNPLPDSITSAKILHLEFVVLQTARNLDTAVFDFVNPVATVQKNGVGETLPLEHSPIYFAIHSFVNVWPGDSDNNGKVDHLDFAPVSQYNGMGSMTKNMRSFKRKSQSSIWAPHRVLTWDSAAVTFADCDGNGDVTYADMLIVSYNMGKDTITKSIWKNEAEIQEAYPTPKKFFGKNIQKIPIYFHSNYEFFAAIGKINWSMIPDNAEILGIEPANVFQNAPYCYFTNNENGKNTEFAIGSYEKQLSEINNGVLAYLVVKIENNEAISFTAEYLTAINQNGTLFPLKLTSSTLEFTEENLDIIENSNSILIKNNTDFDSEINLFGLSRELIFNRIINSGSTFEINKEQLNSGIYFIKTQNLFRKICVVK